MEKKYILVIDQGTTSSRVLLLNKQGKPLFLQQIEIGLIETQDGIIFQNPDEIKTSVFVLIDQIFKVSKINPEEVDSLAITNQRETTVIWDKTTGNPLCNAISWQSKHTNRICEKWIEEGLSEKVFNKTGLTISPYFSASKIAWFIERFGKRKNYVCGTIDTFLLFWLTNKKSFKTDITNASRTMLYNIKDECWDDELLNLFKIPKTMLAEVTSNDSYFGDFVYNDVKIPIRAMIGDQQASLFGHQAFKEGMIKCTYGTGSFMLVNIGSSFKLSKNGLLTTVAWKVNNQKTYALEGSVFICGAVVQWLRDELKIIKTPAESEKRALLGTDDSVVVVPAFVGLGSPYWDSLVRAAILNLKRKSTDNDLIRASLNSICYQIDDIITIFKNEFSLTGLEMKADGGASQNNYIMQFQSNISNLKINQSSEKEVTALGAGYIAGLSTGFFPSIDSLSAFLKVKKIFYPVMPENTRYNLKELWKRAIKAVKSF